VRCDEQGQSLVAGGAQVQTRELLGWNRAAPTLLTDLENMRYALP
jgi:hypothetical protein